MHAPRSAAVIETYALDEEPRADWIIGGVAVSDDVVKRAHLEWYAEHPDAVEAGLVRHRRALEILAAA